MMIAGSVQAEALFRPYDKDLTGYAYPYPVSHYTFKAQQQSLRMAYMDVKPEASKANGKVVVLMHGKNFGGAYWRPTIKALAAEGYRVVVPDQIGFGKSSKPAHLQYSFQALAGWTAGLLDSLKVGKVNVIGHSMGGMLATRFTLMYPERVDRLALVNPIGLEDWRTMVPSKTVDEWYAAELKLTPEKIRAYQAKAYYDGQWKAEYDAAIVPQAGWTLSRDYPRIAWNSALQYDMIFTQPVVYEFKDLERPTLLLVGTRDRTALGKDGVRDEAVKENIGRYDRLGKAVAAMNPLIRFVEFEGVGHVPQVEVFEPYMAELKRFLGQ